ncbi:hypothetical protein V2J09_002686 [Rumex salicifolius]
MLRRLKQSPKVADETMFEGRARANETNTGGGRHGPAWIVFATIYSIIRIPVSALSCFYHQQHGNGADGMWVTGETGRTSEIDHLMVSDSE